MTEEMRNEEMEVMEDEVTTYDLDEYDDEYEESSGILGKLVAGTVTAATAIGGVLVFKNKERINEWRDKRRIEKLEKRGYVVSIPDDDCRVIKEEVIETEDE